MNQKAHSAAALFHDKCRNQTPEMQMQMLRDEINLLDRSVQRLRLRINAFPRNRVNAAYIGLIGELYDIRSHMELRMDALQHQVLRNQALRRKERAA